MMNDTVARIVDLMFDKAEMTEEVTALRDEVMNNCQERYSDLVTSGMSEDDAVAAVVESLKGMEDVIAQYSKKSRKAEYRAAEYTPPADEDAVGGECHMIFAAGEIHQIDLTLVSEDVMLEASEDADYHVIWDADDAPQISAKVDGGVLHIERLPGDWNGNHRGPRSERMETRKRAHVSMNGGEPCYEDVEQTVDQAMNDVGGMLHNLGRSLGRMFSSMRGAFGGTDSVTIQVPEHAVPHVKLLTTSGDIEVSGVALTDLNVTSTSGDIDVELKEDEYVKTVGLRTTSGDIEATVFAQSATLSSTSGDVDVEGRITLLGVNTISGDIDVRADVKNITFKAISGDVDLVFDSDEIRDIRGSTISGDIDIDLPSGIGAIELRTQTRSGDVTTRYATNGCGPTVGGDVSTLSGDITIR